MTAHVVSTLGEDIAHVFGAVVAICVIQKLSHVRNKRRHLLTGGIGEPFVKGDECADHKPGCTGIWRSGGKPCLSVRGPEG